MGGTSSKNAASLVVVCEPIAGWLKDDGTRLMPGSFGEWMDLLQPFCSHLDESKISYDVLSSTLTSTSKRVSFVMSLLEKVL
jgi:hypothetical protein